MNYKLDDLIDRILDGEDRSTIVEEILADPKTRGKEEEHFDYDDTHVINFDDENNLMETGPAEEIARSKIVSVWDAGKDSIERYIVVASDKDSQTGVVGYSYFSETEDGTYTNDLEQGEWGKEIMFEDLPAKIQNNLVRRLGYNPRTQDGPVAVG